jgi:vacuolar-type H+-ATPase subunit E/Vma4
MKEIGEAVLRKVRDEARTIVEEAGESAAREIERGRQERWDRLEAERERLLVGARSEAVRILAQARMTARNRIAAAREAVINDIIGRARKALAEEPSRPEALGRLIEEALSGLDRPGKATVGVAARDIDRVKGLVARSETLGSRVGEVVERKVDGGVVVENESGSLAVDNSYAARLEMLIPRIAVRLAKELFGEEDT